MRSCAIAICWVSLSAVVLAEDPPAGPISGAVFQIPTIEDKFTAEVSAAEARVAKAVAELEKARQSAGVIRLKSYKSKFDEFTKSGNSDQAAAVKARLDWLEERPETPAMPALDQLPPGAAVYQYFPEEEQPYLIKDYLVDLNHETKTMEGLNKQLATAKGAAAIAEVQKQIDHWKDRFEKQRSTNEPPFIRSDINNWGQKKRVGMYEINSKEAEWKPGAIGLIRNTKMRAIQILGKNQVVMTRKYGPMTQTLVFQGFDTSDVRLGRDDSSLAHFGQVVWVSGTTLYRAPNGKDVEVPLIEPFDWERYKAEREEAMKQ